MRPDRFHPYDRARHWLLCVCLIAAAGCHRLTDRTDPVGVARLPSMGRTTGSADATTCHSSPHSRGEGPGVSGTNASQLSQALVTPALTRKVTSDVPPARARLAPAEPLPGELQLVSSTPIYEQIHCEERFGPSEPPAFVLAAGERSPIPTDAASMPATVPAATWGDILPPPNLCGACGTIHRPRMTFEHDREHWLPSLRDDALGLVNWNNGLLLGVAAGGAIAMRQDLDEDVRDATRRHPERWGEATHVLGKMGEVQYQVPVILGVYAWSLHEQDEELHDFSLALINAYTLSGLATVTIKGIADTERPSDEWNEGRFGFPSFHAASSFTIAAVVEEYYGPEAGLPAYALAGLIGWSRIDERDHDLSDVVFGAAMGYIIGKSVARHHREGDGRVRIVPYVHPTDGTPGLLLDLLF